MSELDVNNPVVASILAAATAEFSTYGLGAARLERIIANTHTSKRMVYYHFGSKLGLYQAVLDHVFSAARLREEGTDFAQWPPLQALSVFTGNVFDTFAERPDFARLLTFENLNGASHIQASERISKLNQRSLALVQAILKRGQEDGSMRDDVLAINVYMNIVGLSYYQVANRAGYVAGGFRADQAPQLSSKDFQKQRRQVVIETTLRFVMVLG